VFIWVAELDVPSPVHRGCGRRCGLRGGTNARTYSTARAWAGRHRRQRGELGTGGRGITSESGSDLLSVVDFLTLGNHAFDVGGAGRFLESETRIIRPVNFNTNSPGYGWGTFEAGGVRIGVVNVQGRVSMKHALHSPFRAAERAVDEVEAAGAGLVLVDVHAEATSEKQAMGYHLEGRVQAVV
jgi:2',3'-cyclic-nucleotide 2'-phosphodiesterase